MCEYLDRIIAEGEARGRAEGEARGRAEGAAQINQLNRKLAEAGRYEDLMKAAVDLDFQAQLIKEYQL